MHVVKRFWLSRDAESAGGLICRWGSPGPTLDAEARWHGDDCEQVWPPNRYLGNAEACCRAEWGVAPAYGTCVPLAICTEAEPREEASRG